MGSRVCQCSKGLYKNNRIGIELTEWNKIHRINTPASAKEERESRMTGRENMLKDWKVSRERDEANESED